MGSDILGGLNFAQQFACISANSSGRYFNDLDFAVGIDHEGAAIRQAGFLDQNFEISADGARRISDHGVGDLLDRLGRVVPGLVCEMSVGRHAVDLDAQLLEFAVVFCQILELRRANEGKVSWIEKDDGPFSLQIVVGDRDGGAVLEGVGCERLNIAINQRHRMLHTNDDLNERHHRSEIFIGKIESFCILNRFYRFIVNLNPNACGGLSDSHIFRSPLWEQGGVREAKAGL